MEKKPEKLSFESDGKMGKKKKSNSMQGQKNEKDMFLIQRRTVNESN